MDSFEWMFAIILVVPFIMLGVIAVDLIIEENSEPIDTTYLRSLQDGSSIHGSFSLGSGSIREEPQFIYYAIDGDGYVLRSVPADKSKIIEDENNTPYLKSYNRCITGYVLKQTSCYTYKYEFHVPKETVIQQWNLDGQLR